MLKHVKICKNTVKSKLHDLDKNKKMKVGDFFSSLCTLLMKWPNSFSIYGVLKRFD